MAIQLPNGLALTFEASTVDVGEGLGYERVPVDHQWYLEGRLSVSLEQAVKLYNKKLALTIGGGGRTIPQGTCWATVKIPIRDVAARRIIRHLIEDEVLKMKPRPRVKRYG